MKNLWEGWFDGVCEPRNPGGHAAYGILIKCDGEVVAGRGEYVGYGPQMSNNVAEYSGVSALLAELCVRKAEGAVTIRGDSKLVIEQLNGRWRVRGGLYLPYHKTAGCLLGALRSHCDGGVELIWIPRDDNGECDHYSKQVLRDRGVKLRIQAEPVQCR